MSEAVILATWWLNGPRIMFEERLPIIERLARRHRLVYVLLAPQLAQLLDVVDPLHQLRHFSLSFFLFLVVLLFLLLLLFHEDCQVIFFQREAVVLAVAEQVIPTYNLTLFVPIDDLGYYLRCLGARLHLLNYYEDIVRLVVHSLLLPCSPWPTVPGRPILRRPPRRVPSLLHLISLSVRDIQIPKSLEDVQKLAQAFSS